MKKEEYLEHVKNNELLNRDPDIYDIEDAWIAGYNHAVEMTVEYIEYIEEGAIVYDAEDNKLSQSDLDEFIMNFKKEMKRVMEL